MADEAGVKKISILIVDDEPDFLNAIRHILEVREFHVVTVDRGGKAVDAARQALFDIALVDLKMPGMDGDETLRTLKAEHPEIEVVILTGHGSKDAAAACLESGAMAYLYKPCQLNELLEVLVDAYRKRVMDRHKMEPRWMDDLLGVLPPGSPMAALRRLRELDATPPAMEGRP
ncbi:response regulator receiver protein [Desulfosudis oleivorans Hxd3]|uniref:Response regulator receiver protein n=1 Tax=Desulfosudis oleivorans (strain DSM 6200 / JCM 39069 / Hxd3) TaxID=96561 RepID=A8ZYP7_DESOH|nr:response regulator receiver protein [Desulfosudis oleivorans Hxd3]